MRQGFDRFEGGSLEMALKNRNVILENFESEYEKRRCLF